MTVGNGKSIKQKVLDQINRPLGHITDAEIVRKEELTFLRHRYGGLSGHTFQTSQLPNDAEEYLQRDNPRLRELKQRYRQHESSLTDHSKWTENLVNDDIDLRYFRGDNAYIFQFRNLNADSDYLLTAYYLKTIDHLGLFNILKEDNLFGIYTFPFNDKGLLSRDLLDSIAEIYFLEDTLNISERERMNILDVGAGYGRLVYRLATAFPKQIMAYGVDAVAESTFLSEFYLRFRNVEENTKVVLLDEIENFLNKQHVDLVTNIHSFSECTLNTVVGWLDLIRKHEIRYLLIIPNADRYKGMALYTLEKDRGRINFVPELKARGYRLLATRPKFRASSVQMNGISPTHYYLFELHP